MTNMIFYNPYSSNVQPKGIVFDYADSCDRGKDLLFKLECKNLVPHFVTLQHAQVNSIPEVNAPI